VAKIRPNDSGEPSDGASDEEATRKRKRRTRHETRPSREAGEVPTGTIAMAVALSHPLRVRILYAMHAPERRCSATDIAEESGVDVKRLSYHMRELAAMGFVEQVAERPVRGSLEKIYAPVKGVEAWDLEYSTMPASLKQILAANVLRQGVYALGAAVDKGTFDARDDSMLAQDTMKVDARGADEALAVLDRALKELLEIRENTKARLAETDEEGSLISYLLAGYEGALRPV
jgi:DNA-binding transcriptional ArsR family regulator